MRSPRSRPRSAAQAGTVAPTRIDPAADAPLHRQLAQALRAEILSGRLGPGRRLESSRQLAAQLGVSRNTVLEAFSQLTAEGYLVAAQGSGTYVSDALPEAGPRQASSAYRPAAPGAAEASSALSASARRYVELSSSQRGTELRPFQSGVAALEALPLALWRRVAARAFQDVTAADLGYGDPRGYEPLRRALADLLWSSRGVPCTPEQIFVVCGSQQALDLAARVLLDPGDAAWVEDPGYLGTRAPLVAWGARLVPIPLDREGLLVAHGQEVAPTARLACVTPSHQYPLGTVMGVARRLELLAWARRAGSWIVEDDYDSEFRYEGRPLPALKSLDEADRVLYVGTFSKVLFPALRLGLLLVPQSLVSAFVGARFCAGRQPPISDQVTMHRFLSEGHFARHLRRMRTLYRRRQGYLLEAARSLHGKLEIEPSAAGMHVVGWLDGDRDDHEAAERASELGLRVEPLSRFTLEHAVPPGLILGYTAFDRPAIHHGVALLGAAL